jgi:hypothetical protein
VGKKISGLIAIALGGSILVLWGFALFRAKPLGGLDFRALYEGAGCLIHHHDPFNPNDVRAYYVARGDAQLYPDWALYTLTLLNYPPPTYLFAGIFAAMPWETAQLLWTGLTAISMLLAVALMWSAAQRDGQLAAGLLIGFLLANSEIILAGGNAAGLAVSLCAIAVWCWVEERFVWVGVVCMAASLALKPHDGGLLWLYFLLARGIYRRWALQTLAADVMLGIVSVLWVWRVAPHWLTEMHEIFTIYSAHGGANDPGIIGSPTSAFRHFNMAVFPGMVCDLQSIVAVFRDDPRFYNPVTYLLCAPFLAIWFVVTLRSSFTKARAYLALAAIVPFTLLITYHRTTDTKLLLLMMPACAALWTKGGMVGKLALAVTGVGVFLTGDITLLITGHLAGTPDWLHAGILRRMWMIPIYRPVPVILLAMGIFYLWVYVRGHLQDKESQQAAARSHEAAEAGA